MSGLVKSLERYWTHRSQGEADLQRPQLHWLVRRPVDVNPTAPRIRLAGEATAGGWCSAAMTRKNDRSGDNVQWRRQQL